MNTKLLLLAVSFLLSADAQILKTTQPTNYLREGPGSYYQIIAALPSSVTVKKIEQKGSWIKVSTEHKDQGWLSENSFIAPAGTSTRDEKIIKGTGTSRASRAELAAAVKGFGDRYVHGNDQNTQEISKYSAPIVSPADMEQFEKSFSIEPFRGFLEVERPFDLRFHEEAIGLSIAQKIATQKGIVRNAAATLYINLIGNHIAKYTKAYDLGFRLYILNDSRAAAFSVPGGYIFVTVGMFRACTNEAELASVIAHEMIHVIQRHGIKELEKNKAKIKAEEAFAELERETGPMSDEEKELEEYAERMYQQLISPRLLSYEIEADNIALAYITRAGYDPSALYATLERITVAESPVRDIFDEKYMKKDDVSERLSSLRGMMRHGRSPQHEKQFESRYFQYTSGLR